jgi:arabinofuranosyltransferase
MAGIMGLGLLLLDEPKTLRRLATIAACALTIPAAYEVFRMCYYGNLLPNPAYSKEATFANWPQGWQYLKDFERPYRLWVPALALLLGALVKPDVVRGRRGLAFFTPAVAGAVYAAFIVRGGGDFMHARMLLPATFALLLPVAAAPLRWSSVVALVAIILWTTVPLSAGGPPYREIGPFGITNERNVWAGKLENPVTLEDYASLGTTLLGKLVRADVDSGKTYVAVFTLAAAGSQPLAPSAPSFSQRGVIGGCSIGMLGVAAGDDIYVADECGLASPIGSRLLLLRRSRPGHEKILRPSWIFAMFGDPNAPAPDSTPATEIASARAALACPEIRAMLDRARAPLGWSRIAQNVVESFTAFRTRFHPDPATAAMHCGRVAGSDTPPSIMAAGRS